MRLTVLGAGFIGLNFIYTALAEGHVVTVLDRKPCSPDLQNQLKWVQGDFFDTELLSRVLHQAEVVFHFVATTVPGDQVDEATELASNVGQTLKLLQLCVREKVKRIVFTSSASVYGIQKSALINEECHTNPISSHGISKLTIEKYLLLYKYHYGLDCKVLRLSNPYGPRQDIYGRQGFIAIAAGKILSGEPLVIRGDGSTIRDYIHIADVCEALIRVCHASTAESIFNIGSGLGFSLSSVVAKLAVLIARPIPVEYAHSRFVDIPTSILDVSKAKKLLGFESRYNLNDGLLDMLNHHKITTIK